MRVCRGGVGEGRASLRRLPGVRQEFLRRLKHVPLGSCRCEERQTGIWGLGGLSPFQGAGVFHSKLSACPDYGAEVLLDGASI